ncbi:MAG: hypothetical protein MZV63_18440 [Marinilabiliales bacterium]|nr:hypothetical protein [Marinilabiliales bacterium]
MAGRSAEALSILLAFVALILIYAVVLLTGVATLGEVYRALLTVPVVGRPADAFGGACDACWGC